MRGAPSRSCSSSTVSQTRRSSPSLGPVGCEDGTIDHRGEHERGESADGGRLLGAGGVRADRVAVVGGGVGELLPSALDALDRRRRPPTQPSTPELRDDDRQERADEQRRGPRITNPAMVEGPEQRRDPRLRRRRRAGRARARGRSRGRRRASAPPAAAAPTAGVRRRWARRARVRGSDAARVRVDRQPRAIRGLHLDPRLAVPAVERRVDSASVGQRVVGLGQVADDDACGEADLARHERGGDRVLLAVARPSGARSRARRAGRARARTGSAGSLLEPVAHVALALESRDAAPGGARPRSSDAGAHSSSRRASSSGSSGAAGSTLVPGRSTARLSGSTGTTDVRRVRIARLEADLHGAGAGDVVVEERRRRGRSARGPANVMRSSCPMPGTHTSAYPTHLDVESRLSPMHVGLVEPVRHAGEAPGLGCAVAAADRVHDRRRRCRASAMRMPAPGGRPAHLQHGVVGDLGCERRAESGERAVVRARLERRLQLGADDAPRRDRQGHGCRGRARRAPRRRAPTPRARGGRRRAPRSAGRPRVIARRFAIATRTSHADRR